MAGGCGIQHGVLDADFGGEGESPAAIEHAYETVPSISGILGNSAFGLSPSEDGFIMFNEDDLLAYLRD